MQQGLFSPEMIPYGLDKLGTKLRGFRSMYVLDISSGDLMLTMLVGCPLSPLSYGSAVELYGAFQCNALLYIQLFQGLSVFFLLNYVKYKFYSSSQNYNKKQIGI